MSNTVHSMNLLGQNQDDLKKIHDRSIDLVENHGIRFHSGRALEILHGAGAKIEGNIAKIPGDLVESSLKKAPGSFTLYARDPQFDLNLDGKHTFYSQDGCAAFTKDFETGERRQSRKEDIEKMALIADSLNSIDIITPTVSAQDMPAAGVNAHELEACFRNTGKPVVTVSVTSAKGAKSQIDMAAAVLGGKEALRKRPIFCNFVCPITPLIHDSGGIEAALEFAGAGVPVGVYPMAIAGVTSPVTLAGTMVVLNAEVVSGLALIQLATPGAKVFYAGGPATLNLPTGTYTSSSPEAFWLRMMVAEMAKFYGLPSIVGAGATNSKVPGAQAAWENSVSILLTSLAGAGFLFGLGLLDGSNLLTYEEIILDAECAATVRRILSGVDFSADAFALDIIKELGPGGVFLSEHHTVDHMREALSIPQLSDRDSYEDWSQKGKLSRVEVAKERVKEILSKHKPFPLSESVKKKMKEVLSAYSE